jgi:hypothetical protein
MEYLQPANNDNNCGRPRREPIFVVGTPRSGTTLLGLLLNAHPDIAIMGELHFFDQILPIRKQVPSLATNADLDTFSSHVRRTHAFQFLPYAEELLSATLQRLRRDRERTYERFYQYAVDEFARRERVSIPGEKTTSNVRYIDRIMRIFPNAKIVHIIRDPRAVAASLSRMRWASYGVLVNALKWKLDILGTQQYRDRHTYREIQYEELVSQPCSSLKKLCEFLEVPYTDKMLEYHKMQAAYIKCEPWKDGTRQPISKTNVAAWRQQLSVSQIHMIQLVTRHQMNGYGYDPVEIPSTTKIALPFTLLAEILCYLSFKVKQRQLRAADNPSVQYFGESRTLWIGVLRALSRCKRIDYIQRRMTRTMRERE